MAVASNLKLLVFPRRKKNYMKKILIIIILIFLACKKEKVKESGFDYVHFTPLNSAFVKITDHSKYKIRLLTVIDGVEKEYPVGFYKEDFKEFLNILKDCEVLFFINFEESEKRISITYSMRKKGDSARGQNIMYIPIEGKLKEQSQDFSKSLNAKFTIENEGKKNLFVLEAKKVKRD